MLRKKTPCSMVRLEKIAIKVSRLSDTIHNKKTRNVNAMAWYHFEHTKQKTTS